MSKYSKTFLETSTEFFSDKLRAPAIRALRLKAMKTRKLLLMKRWNPGAFNVGSSQVNPLKNKKGNKAFFNAYREILLNVFRTQRKEGYNRADFVHANVHRANQLSKTLGPVLDVKTQKKGFKNKKEYTSDVVLLHKETAKFSQRFYPVGKAVFPSYGIIRVTTVSNNCFVGITDVWGKSYAHGSTGSISDKTMKVLSQPAFQLGMKMARKAMQGGMKTFLLVMGGPGKSAGAAQGGIMKVVQRHWKAARKENLLPTFKRAGTIFLKSIPHNGCRLPARRRKRRKTKVRPLKVGKF